MTFSTIVFLFILCFIFTSSAAAGECGIGEGLSPPAENTKLKDGETIRLQEPGGGGSPILESSEGYVEGRLEVLYEDEWRAIHRSESDWGREEALVACSILASELKYNLFSYEALIPDDLCDSLNAANCDFTWKKSNLWNPAENLWKSNETCHKVHPADLANLKNVGVRCQFRNNTDPCADCTRGRFRKVVKSVFQEDVSHSICQVCDAGKFSTRMRMSICESCPSNKFAARESDVCRKCNTTQVQNSDGSGCGCPLGKGLGSDDDQCKDCEAGEFSSDKSLQCSTCPKDSYCEGNGTKVPTLCPYGRVSAEGAKARSQCFSQEELWDDLFVLIDDEHVRPNDIKSPDETEFSAGNQIDPYDDYDFIIMAEGSHSEVKRCSASEQNDCELVVRKLSSERIDFLQVDPSKKLLYVLIGSLGEIHAYDYSVPIPTNPLKNPTNKVDELVFPELAGEETITKLLLRPRFAIEKSAVTTPSNVTAGDEITLPLHISAQYNNMSTANLDITEIKKRILVKANAVVPMQWESTEGVAKGYVELDGQTETNLTNSSLSALTINGKLTLNTATYWNVSVMGIDVNDEEKHFSGSPFTINVKQAKTSAKNVEVELLERNLIAGKTYNARIRTYDKFRNPTMSSVEQIEFDFGPRNCKYNISSTEYDATIHNTAIHNFTFSCFEAGPLVLDIRYSNESIAGGPFGFTVEPEGFDEKVSKKSINIAECPQRWKCGESPPGVDECDGNAILVFDSSPEDTCLEKCSIRFEIIPKDKFGNNRTCEDEDFTIEISEMGSGVPRIVPGCNHTWPVKDMDVMKLIVQFRYLKKKLREVDIEITPVKEVGDTSKHLNLMIYIFIAIIMTCPLLRMLLLKYATEGMMEKERKELKNEAKVLEEEKDNLAESLRAKKHSDKEIEIMMKALEELENEREDELRSVLIPSSKVKIDKMLGQGAFGTVSLATYKADGDDEGQKVAIKQLTNIDNDNIKRFRFECFLTKELRHPNVVRLVGVCWDDMMMGCCLEFIDGGSLEDRLKKDWILPRNEKMTWKGVMLKMATEAALGVQYLHHSQYFDEEKNELRECIIHRDLKPDNMLVTKPPDNVLKLTDFGEARAQELSMTMTAVGTPIYISPEIVRNDRYDSKADTYSYGVVLLAMMRAEKNIVEFFFQALMKKRKKKNRIGLGINLLNRELDKGWRPPVPIEFYPKLTRLIERCLRRNPKERPDFDEIVKELTGRIAVEVGNAREPVFGSGIIIKDNEDEDYNLATGRSIKGDEVDEDHNDIEQLLDRNRELEDEVLMLKETIALLEKDKKQLEQRLKELERETGNDPNSVGFVGSKGKKAGGSRKEEPTIVYLPGQANMDREVTAAAHAPAPVGN
eukprot:CAMPEP_0118651786 /NCGR_PEP_ID=MMETSP0785-20121206/10967_1 /TAXON_ID=91992 /ORGANISM="Bolidomonas pacifica, Strain CCMP 1866" /LENGTH=1363 /DNA_ID=CAMNT_0006544253 /DNA_START=76 /DNA_END=4164 /DNA_ORIENTATION=+